MHSITLDIAAGVLLISSITSLGLLLKRTPKSRLFSSISVLSISDMTSSVLIAVMILLHQFFINDRNSVNYRINKIDTSGHFSGTFIKGGYYLKDSVNGDDENSEISDECDYKSVLFQYAMFIVPFANAFTSLLSFSANYYLNTSQIDRRCCKWYETLKETKRTAAESDGSADTVQVLESDIVSKKVDIKDTSVLEKLMDFKFSNNNKYTLLAILSQWIVPAVFSGAFKLGEHENVQMTNRSSEDLICTLVANFPFEDCMDNFQLENKRFPSLYDYVGSEDNLMWPNPNSTEADDVISKVHNIMQSVLAVHPQIIYKNESKQDHYSATQLLDIVNTDGIGPNSTALGNQSFVDEDVTVLETDRLLRQIIEQGLVKHNNRIGAARELYNTTSFTRTFLNDERALPNNAKPLHCMNNRCVMSMQFLKINLFIFFILVYFTPIFLSALLLVISYYKCREITGKLEENHVKSGLIEGAEITNSEGEKSPRGSPTGWFPSNQEEEMKTDTISQVQKNENQLSENFSRSQKIKCELSCQTKKLQNFFQIFKVNALVAVVLWTPFFLQVLSKVLFCSNVPKWLMETTFLATIVFAIFRNAVDLNMMKIKADADDYSKQSNTVYSNV